MATGDLLGFGDATPAPPDIQHLMNMFPGVDRIVVEEIYENIAGGNVEKATEALLSITDDQVDMAKVQQQEQERQDELVALQVLQEMMNEEARGSRGGAGASSAASAPDADRMAQRMANDQKVKGQSKGVKQALARQLGKIKAKAKGGSSAPEYQQHYASLLDDEKDMKI